MLNKNISLEKLEEWANKVSPVFIVGMARSGTTMVYNAFRNNEAFKLLCEDNESPETFLFCSLKNKLPINFNPMLSQYLANDTNMDLAISLFGNIVPQDKVRLKREGNILKALSESQEFLTEFQKSVFAKIFFYVASELIDGKRVIEKTPSHSSCIDDIYKVFPNAKIIHCHRNMVDVLGSIRQRLNKEKELARTPEEYEWLNKNVNTYVEQYNGAQQAYMNASEKYNGKIIFTSYEKIIAAPEAEFTKLCNFVGVDFNEAMVEGKRKGHAQWESYAKDKIKKREYGLDGLISDDEIKYISGNSINMTDYIR